MESFTCWGELNEGCYIIHKTIEEAAVCAVETARSAVLKIDNNELNRFWITTAYGIPVAIFQTDNFNFSDNEKDYLIDFGLI